jgi:hypothetical protein
MTLGANADEAFAYLTQKFGEDYVLRNASAALRFAGDWINAATRDDVAQAIFSLQDALIEIEPKN